MMASTVRAASDGRIGLEGLCGAVPVFQNCVRETQSYTEQLASATLPFRTDLVQTKRGKLRFVEGELLALARRAAEPPRSTLNMRLLGELRAKQLQLPSDEKEPTVSSIVPTGDNERVLLVDSANCCIKELVVPAMLGQQEVVPAPAAAAASAENASLPTLKTDWQPQVRTLVQCAGCPGGAIALNGGEYVLSVEWFEGNRLFLMAYVKTLLDAQRSAQRQQADGQVAAGTGSSKPPQQIEVYIEEKKLELEEKSPFIESALIELEGGRLLVCVSRHSYLYEYKWRVAEKPRPTSIAELQQQSRAPSGKKGANAGPELQAASDAVTRELKLELARRLQLPARLTRIHYAPHARLFTLALEDRRILLMDRQMRPLVAASGGDGPFGSSQPVPSGSSPAVASTLGGLGAENHMQLELDYLKPNSVLLVDFDDHYDPYRPLDQNASQQQPSASAGATSEVAANASSVAAAAANENKFQVLVANWAKSSVEQLDLRVPPQSARAARMKLEYSGRIANKVDVRCWSETIARSGRLLLFDQLHRTLALVQLYNCYFLNL